MKLLPGKNFTNRKNRSLIEPRPALIEKIKKEEFYLARHVKKSGKKNRTSWGILVLLCLAAFIVGYIISV